MTRSMNGSTGRQEGGAHPALLIAGTLAVVGLAIVGLRFVQPSHREAGFEAFELGDYEQAEAIFDRVLKSDSRDIEARYFRGLARLEQRDFKAAASDFGSLRTTPEIRARAYYQLVRTYVLAEQLEEAQAEVEQVSGDLLESPLVREANGLYYLARTNEAADDISQALTLGLGEARVRRVGGRPVRVLYAENRVYNASLDRLFEVLDGLGLEDPSQLEPIFDRGHRDLMAAYAAFDRATDLADASPDGFEVPRARTELAGILEIRGRAGKVEDQRRKIIATKSERMQGDVYFETQLRALSAAATLDLAEALNKLDRHEDALEVILAVEPDEKTGERGYRLERVQAACYEALGRYDPMLVIADRWLERDSKLPSLNFLKGKYLFDKEEYEEALPYLEKAVTKTKRATRYNEYLARCYIALSKHDRANSILENLVESEPDDWEMRKLQIRAMEGMGWLEDARKELTKVLNSTFKDRSTRGHKELRRFLNEFLEKHGLSPTDLHTALELYTDDPSNFDAGRRYLTLLLEADSVGRARTVAERLARECPDDDPFYYEAMLACGRFQYADDAFERAIELYRLAARERPWMPAPYVGQFWCYLTLERYGSAADALDKIRTLDAKQENLPELQFRLCMATGDFAGAVKHVDGYLAVGKNAPATILEAARAHLGCNDPAGALAVASRVDTEDIRDRDLATRHALVLIETGSRRKGEPALTEALERPPRDDRLTIAVSKKLQQLEDHELVIKLLEPVVEGDPDASDAALELLADSYQALDRPEIYVSMLARLNRKGRQAKALRRAAEFCRRHGATTEVMSIAESAFADQIADTALLKTAIEVAVEIGDLPRAERYLRRFRVSGDASDTDRAVLTARVLDAKDQMVKALDELDGALRYPAGKDVAALRRARIEILGRRGQVAELEEELERTLRTGPAELLVDIAIALIPVRGVEALPALDRAVAGAPSARAHLERGLVRIAAEDGAGAFEDLERAWELDPGATTGPPYLLSAASRGRRRLIGRVLHENPTWATAELRSCIDFIGDVRRRRFAAAVREVPGMMLGSPDEGRALARLLKAAADHGGDANAVRKHLWRYLALARHGETARLATAAIDALDEEIEGHDRCLTLLRARCLIGDDRTFSSGIKLVTGLLNESGLKDEAGLCIYAESFLRSGQVKELETLVAMTLEMEGLSADFYRGLAGVLLDAGLPLQAAKLLYRSPESSPAKVRAEARALYRSGNLERAARVLMKQEETEKDALYHQIVGEFLTLDKNTRRQGFDMARRSVYDFGPPEPEAHISLARAAFRVGDRAEGRKNIHKFLALQPASARAVVTAFEVVDEFATDNLQLHDWLQNRLALLDPSGFYKAM